MSPASQQLRLLFESSATEGPFEHLVVPVGVSFLLAPANQRPEIRPIAPATFEEALILEPILTAKRQPRLLVLNPARGRFQFRGETAPRVAIMAEKDEFTLNHETSFFVSLFNQRWVGAPAPSVLGKPCPVCRVPITPKSIVYHCACGGAIHSESPTEDGGTLDCLSYCAEAVCPVCRQQPIIVTDGFTWLPESSHA